MCGTCPCRAVPAEMGMSFTQKDPTRTGCGFYCPTPAHCCLQGWGHPWGKNGHGEEGAIAVLTPVLCVCRDRAVAELPGEMPLSPQVLQLGMEGWDGVGRGVCAPGPCAV